MKDSWKKYTKGLSYNGTWLDKETINTIDTAEFESWENDIFQFMKEWTSDLPYVLVKTSGSTGKPKTIELHKSSMAASAQFTCRYLGLEKGDAALLCLPVQFIGGKMMVVRSFVYGLVLHTQRPTSRLTIEKDFAFTAMTPHQFQSTLSSDPNLDKKLKTTILGGSAPAETLLRQIRNYKSTCYITYGMTETSSHIALKKLNSSDENLFEKIDASILLSTNKNRCLIIQAPYLGKNTIETNDVVKIVDPNHFKWLGRVDNVINSAGVKLHPEMIERKLAPAFNFRFFIFGEKHEKYGERPSILVESEGIQSTEYIWRTLKKKLLKIEQPDAIYITPKLVETQNGKVSRAASIKIAKRIN